tara:strand:- start:17519 stop:17797 length:279 start_codon:yes stop_codon:yes gene_type:complete
MKLTKDVAREIIWDCCPGWKIIESELVDTRRWVTTHCDVALHEESGKYYEFTYSKGATEMQDEQPFEYEDEVTPVEVIPKEVTKTIFVQVQD